MSRITTIQLARAVALAAIDFSGLPKEEFRLEEIDDKHAPYLGVLIARKGTDERGVHLYLCDDDPGSEMWMLDPSDFFNGNVDPRPMEPVFLQFCLEWLFADAWLLVSADGAESITTDYEAARTSPTDLRFPLNSVPRGKLLAFLDPTTGEIATTDTHESRFTKPLYCSVTR